ncbi:aminotransferase class I/II-fold pyridoxal phosphate-dependent enzyme [Pollutimonas bauzanensis]|uniref:Aminotransferase n=1 Tax=Pollutimonas bauzanensis TaxID=658167 RepID=A0A1M5ZKP2_9BURK|nr:aminotransferase class I/II-fold pyridoxal phosphate-dependent enzyme [Pollutimonas bauzanensis]SHI24513.1 aspartate aminotransferase [Pollutimonas bauzanensis]
MSTTQNFAPAYLAKRMQLIKPSASMMAKKKVDTLRSEGKQVIDFTLGEPDLNTPAHIAQAGMDAIRNGYTKYTATSGIKELLLAIQAKYRRENQLDFNLDQLVVGTGAKQLIFSALSVTLDKDDEVIIPAPYWVSYPDMVLLNDGKPVILETSGDNGFKITAESLEAAITDRTKWLLLNSPNNPSGSLYTETELGDILDVLERHPQVLLMIDEIYEHFSYEQDYVSPLAVDPAIRDRTLLINGVSKAYAMTGWRIGYAAGPSFLIKAIATLISQTTSCASEISQKAAAAALSGDQSCVRDTTALYRTRRDTMVDLLGKVPGVTCPRPAGAFYVFPDIQGLIGKTTPQGKTLGNDLDVVHYFLDAAGVAVLDGTAYGVPGYIRLSFATDLETIKAGCEKLSEACSQLK